MAEKEARDPGQRAFEVYNRAVGGKTFDGKDLHWGMIGERQREGWSAVERALEVKPLPSLTYEEDGSWTCRVPTVRTWPAESDKDTVLREAGELMREGVR